MPDSPPTLRRRDWGSAGGESLRNARRNRKPGTPRCVGLPLRYVSFQRCFPNVHHTTRTPTTTCRVSSAATPDLGVRLLSTFVNIVVSALVRGKAARPPFPALFVLSYLSHRVFPPAGSLRRRRIVTACDLHLCRLRLSCGSTLISLSVCLAPCPPAFCPLPHIIRLSQPLHRLPSRSLLASLFLLLCVTHQSTSAIPAHTPMRISRGGGRANIQSPRTPRCPRQYLSGNKFPTRTCARDPRPDPRPSACCLLATSGPPRYYVTKTPRLTRLKIARPDSGSRRGEVECGRTDLRSPTDRQKMEKFGKAKIEKIEKTQ